MWETVVRGDPEFWLVYLEGWESPLTETGVLVGGLGRKQRLWYWLA